MNINDLKTNMLSIQNFCKEFQKKIKKFENLSKLKACKAEQASWLNKELVLTFSEKPGPKKSSFDQLKPRSQRQRIQSVKNSFSPSTLKGFIENSSLKKQKLDSDTYSKPKKLDSEINKNKISIEHAILIQTILKISVGKYTVLKKILKEFYSILLPSYKTVF